MFYRRVAVMMIHSDVTVVFLDEVEFVIWRAHLVNEVTYEN